VTAKLFAPAGAPDHLSRNKPGPERSASRYLIRPTMLSANAATTDVGVWPENRGGPKNSGTISLWGVGRAPGRGAGAARAHRDVPWAGLSLRDRPFKAWMVVRVGLGRLPHLLRPIRPRAAISLLPC